MSDDSNDEQISNEIRGLEVRLIDTASNLPLKKTLRETQTSKNGAMRREWDVVARPDHWFAVEFFVKSSFEWMDANALELSLGFDTGREVYEQSVYFLRPDLESTHDLMSTLNLIPMVRTHSGYQGRLDYLLKSTDLIRSGTDLKAYFKFISLQQDDKKAAKAVDLNQGRIRIWIERRIMGKPERTRDREYLIDPVVRKPRARRNQLISAGITLEICLDFQQNLSPKAMKVGFRKGDCSGLQAGERFNFLFFYKEECSLMDRLTTTMNDDNTSISTMFAFTGQKGNTTLTLSPPTRQARYEKLSASTSTDRKRSSSSPPDEQQDDQTITVCTQRKTSAKKKRGRSCHSASPSSSSSPQHRVARNGGIWEGAFDDEHREDTCTGQRAAERGKSTGQMSSNIRQERSAGYYAKDNIHTPEHDFHITSERTLWPVQSHRRPMTTRAQSQHSDDEFKDSKVQSKAGRQQVSEPAEQSLELEAMISEQQFVLTKFDETLETIKASLRAFREALIKHQKRSRGSSSDCHVETEAKGSEMTNAETNVSRCISRRASEGMQFLKAQPTAVNNLHNKVQNPVVSEEGRSEDFRHPGNSGRSNLSPAADDGSAKHSCLSPRGGAHHADLTDATRPVSISSDEDLQHDHPKIGVSILMASTSSPKQSNDARSCAGSSAQRTKDRMKIAKLLN